MRLTVAQLKPWMVTALVVLVILLAGGFYLTRLALRDQPLAGPSWAPGSPAAAPASPSPEAPPTSGRVTSAPRPSSRSPEQPTTTRTRPTPSRTTPPPPPVKVPTVLVAGPTVDNDFPDSTGCHVFWVDAPGLRVTVAHVGFRTGQTPSPDPSASPSVEARPLRVAYVACNGPADNGTVADVGCGTGRVVSQGHGCGVRISADEPTRTGLYQGKVSFDLSARCTGTRAKPCSDIDSPYRPSPDRPVTATWGVTCAVRLDYQGDPGTSDVDPVCSVRSP
jgi:hypothetical protein